MFQVHSPATPRPSRTVPLFLRAILGQNLEYAAKLRLITGTARIGSLTHSTHVMLPRFHLWIRSTAHTARLCPYNSQYMASVPTLRRTAIPLFFPRHCAPPHARGSSPPHMTACTTGKTKPSRPHSACIAAQSLSPLERPHRCHCVGMHSDSSLEMGSRQQFTVGYPGLS